MNPDSFYPPRWRGGPSIRPATNLPAFEEPFDLDAFLLANGPSCKVIRKFLCEHCDCWHAETKAPDPAGNSSGTGRGSK